VTRRTLVLGGLLWLPLVAAAQAVTETPEPVRIVRCAPSVRVVCLQAAQPARPTNTAHVRLGAASDFTPVERGVGGTVSRYRGAPMYLQVLFDVSGSLKDEQLTAAIGALTEFMGRRKADSSRVRMAISRFGDLEVESRITRTPFLVPEAALAQLSSLPKKRTNENTALYSAIAAAADRLARIPEADAAYRRVLLVITDGRNDVKDDRQLLGNTALPQVAAMLRRGQIETVLLGFGSSEALAYPQLDSLAGERGVRLTTSQFDLASAGALLDSADAAIFSRDRLFATSDDISTLSRVRRDAGIWSSDDMRLRLRWHAPLVALAAFHGTLTTEGLSVETAQSLAALERPPYERWLAFVLVLAGLGAAWTLVPARLWPPIVMERNVKREVADVAPAVSGASVLPALESVREAPPRTAADVTGEFPILPSP
jgi:Mg-chelatase subunit ChlD